MAQSEGIIVTLQRIWLIRHGETEWSLSGQHTGSTDIPLTDIGAERARLLKGHMENHQFNAVLTSPLQRAQETCRLAGYGDHAEITDDLLEWDYGQYEGKTTAEIQETVPGWSLWTHPCPGGETGEQVATRVQRVIDRAIDIGGDVACFAHGHVLRVLIATWLEMNPQSAKYFALGTASLTILGHEHDYRVLRVLNEQWHLP